MNGATTIDSESVLIVEGPDDAAVVREVLRRSGKEWVQILPAGGKDRINDLLDVLVKTPGFKRVRWLGVMRDADHNATGAFRSVCAGLGRAHLPVPSAAWTVATQGRPHIAVAILPDGRSPGDLETVIWDGVQAGARRICVEEYLDCLRRGGVDVDRALSKARVQAYLAGAPKAGYSIRDAVAAHLLPLASADFGRLVDLVE